MGISIGHLIIVVVILLLLFGPSKLPSLGRSLGESIRNFKDGLNGSGDLAEKAKKQLEKDHAES